MSTGINPNATCEDQAALTALWSRCVADSRPLGSVERFGTLDGFSGARLWSYQSARGRLLARCWPRIGPSVEHIERIHSWLRTLSDLPFIATPIRLSDGRTAASIGSATFQIEPCLRGDAVSAPTDEQLAAAFSALGRVHLGLSAFRASDASAGLVSRCRETQEFIDHERRTLTETVKSHLPSEERTVALRFLDQSVEPARSLFALLQRSNISVATQPCLRDCRAAHFLFEGERLCGLVDYGAMDVECIAADLARLLADWDILDPARRRVAFEAYSRVAPLDEKMRMLVPIFERCAVVLGPLRWIRWHFVERRQLAPGVASRSLERGLERLALMEIGEGVYRSATDKLSAV